LICKGSIERLKVPAGRNQIDEVHQNQVVTVARVTANALIVIQRIAAAIKDEAITIDFNWSWMMHVSDSSGSRLTPGAFCVAAHSTGTPLEGEPNEKARRRAFERLSAAGCADHPADTACHRGL
jgi:hypothetical protein